MKATTSLDFCMHRLTGWFIFSLLSVYFMACQAPPPQEPPSPVAVLEVPLPSPEGEAVRLKDLDKKYRVEYLNQDYIVFSKADSSLIHQVFRRNAGQTYSSYLDSEVLMENPEDAPLWFKEIRGDVLVYNMGTSGFPHNIYFFDLQNQKQLLDDSFRIKRYDMDSPRKTILKPVGPVLPEQLKDKLDHESADFAAVASKDNAYIASTLYYWEMWEFNVDTRELRDLDLVYTSVGE